LKVAENFIPVPLTLEIVENLVKHPLLEIHDRIMVVTAKLLNASLITKDKEIMESKLVKTIWE